MATFVLDADLPFVLFEYAAILDLETKESTYKQQYKSLVDEGNLQNIHRALLESIPTLLKFSSKALEPSLNLFIQALNLINKETLTLPQDLTILAQQVIDSDITGAKISILSTIFNLLPVDATIRLSILESIVNDMIVDDYPLKTITENISTWLKPFEDKSREDLVNKIFVAYYKQDPKGAYEFAKKNQTDEIIQRLISSETYFDMSPFNSTTTSASASASTTTTQQLVKIYNDKDYNQFKSSDFTSLSFVDTNVIGSKLQLLTIVSLCSDNHVIPYDTIAKQFNIEINQVESFIFPLIAQGVIKAKLSQSESTLTVSSISALALDGDNIWESLESTLGHWSAKMEQLSKIVGEASENFGKKKKTPTVLGRYKKTTTVN
ncbi:hypothetical protein DAMA08_053460 [Martiniozyma asiatica (nom. inval.)]|nr:hypothetical protein DAMA08_053460 [Martiniozyma asiatica]